MREDFLHYIWRMKSFNLDSLTTTSGDKIQLINNGEYNKNAGPDFLNARLKIGTTLWAGNVEIHLKTSDWIKHQHQNDPAYDNVILHVVLEEDLKIKRKTGAIIPCLELKERISPKLQANYLRLLSSEHWISCEYHLHKINLLTKKLWLDRILVERLEEKTQSISELWNQNKSDWEETFFQCVAKSLGTKVNAQAFEILSRICPLGLLRKHKENLFQLEALLFGQAGMLEKNFEELYPNQLKKEYSFLREKYSLKQMDLVNWKYLRLRPANFPSVRIAQLAKLIFQSNHLFSKVLAVQNIKEIENMLSLKISNYWEKHYRFDKISVKRKKSLGKSTIHLISINTIVPFLFFYGKMKDEQRFKDLAFRLLQEIPAEKNTVIEGWTKLDMTSISAYETQALLQLKKHYCDNKRCTECNIGAALLRA